MWQKKKNNRSMSSCGVCLFRWCFLSLISSFCLMESYYHFLFRWVVVNAFFWSNRSCYLHFVGVNVSPFSSFSGKRSENFSDGFPGLPFLCEVCTRHLYIAGILHRFFPRFTSWGLNCFS